jgi:magnesium transporter
MENPIGADERISPVELTETWPVLSLPERLEAFALIDRSVATEFFAGLDAASQVELLLGMPPEERRLWLRLLEPDDVADVLQAAPEGERAGFIALLDEATRKEVAALLAYAEDEAGGLMSPRYARLRPDLTVDEAIVYLRRQARERLETIYYVYVLGADQKLLGVVSFRELFAAPSGQTVRDIMRPVRVSAREDTDQEDLARLFRQHGFLAIPVLDVEGRMKGIVTIDDIVDVVEEEATEDIQKMGGAEALGEPYLQIRIHRMIRKRAGWLAALFLGEMLTASAMSYYEEEIAQAVILALFLPLIISSGGNSGSQATTLVIRAMALGEVRLRDWYRVVRRELVTGLGLGVILGAIGFVRIVLWHALFGLYAGHVEVIGATVALSLTGVVLWGSIIGSMLPFLLRKLGFDPASASAPFVATLVDVTGLIIYFTVARWMMAALP